MNAAEIAQIILSLGALALLAPPLGRYMARVYRGQPHLLSRPLGWLERGAELALGRGAYAREMDWRGYALALLAFNGLGLLAVFTLQLAQHALPLNPQQLAPATWHLAFNTAVSFVTNTNWQSYAGETTYSYLVQMLGLAVQNFVSAATGMAVAVALARGLASRGEPSLGNFWRDLTRGVVYILLPLSMLLAAALVSQGVVQTFAPAAQATTLEGAEQKIPLGPAASQIAIKQLGTNGGGFYNANSAHPLENPTPLSNWLSLMAILLIPAGFAFLWGDLVGSRRQGALIFLVMFAILAASLGGGLWSELTSYGATPELAPAMEGKETRLGVVNSVMWSTFTTAASNGSVNSMHGSLTPLAGGLAMLNIMLGEVVFGGVGSGLYGIAMFAILTVFLAGLMVGRTPEYLGKKIEAREIRWVIAAVLIPSAAILVGAGLATVWPGALASLANGGPRGFSEILYAFTSAAGNNGSAFAGLNANVPFYNVALGVAMLVGRFGVILPALVVAGSLARKRPSPPSAGTFATDSALFGVLLAAVILIVGGLTFLPALSLGPIVEHLMLASGQTF